MGGNGVLPPSPLHKSINQEGPASYKLQIGKLDSQVLSGAIRPSPYPFYPLPFEVEPAGKAVTPGSIPTGLPALCPDPTHRETQLIPDSDASRCPVPTATNTRLPAVRAWVLTRPGLQPTLRLEAADDVRPRQRVSVEAQHVRQRGR